MRRLIGPRASPSMLVALIGLLVALGGTSYAAVTTLLPKNSVGSAQVINGSLEKADLSRDAITRLKGNRGSRCPVGSEGAVGPAGPAGPAGAQGPKGDTGATGATGP